MAPPGICPIRPMTPPIDSTRPISTCVHFSRGQVDRDERTEAGLHVGEKEDEPVEAAQALREGCGLSPRTPAEAAQHCLLPTAPSLRSPSSPLVQMRWARDQNAAPPCLMIEIEGLKALPAAPSTTIGVSSLYSGAAATCALVSSSVMLSRLLLTPSEMQRAPVDHDLAAADAEKAAEIDHRGAHRAGAIDDHIDDAPHVLVRWDCGPRGRARRGHPWAQ